MEDIVTEGGSNLLEAKEEGELEVVTRVVGKESKDDNLYEDRTLTFEKDMSDVLPAFLVKALVEDLKYNHPSYIQRQVYDCLKDQ